MMANDHYHTNLKQIRSIVIHRFKVLVQILHKYSFNYLMIPLSACTPKLLVFLISTISHLHLFISSQHFFSLISYHHYDWSILSSSLRHFYIFVETNILFQNSILNSRFSWFHTFFYTIYRLNITNLVDWRLLYTIFSKNSQFSSIFLQKSCIVPYNSCFSIFTYLQRLSKYS